MASVSFCIPSQLALSERDPQLIIAYQAQHIYRWQDWLCQVKYYASRFICTSYKSYVLTVENSWNFLIGLFALWYAGKKIIIPPNNLPLTLLQISTEFDAILNDSDFQKEYSFLPEYLVQPLRAEECELIIYTSGSTGEPKAILKTLKQLEAEIEVLHQMWGARYNRAKRIVSTVPHHHIYGLLFRLLWPLAAAVPFEVELFKLPDELFRQASLTHPIILVSSPAHLSRLPELIDISKFLTFVNICFSSGGAVTPETAGQFIEASGFSPIEVLGSTETGGIAWRQQKQNDVAWSALPKVICTQAPDTSLVVQSPFVRASWKTADSVEFLADGRWILKGRLDRIIKMEEKRLSLEELETNLCQHAWVEKSYSLVLEKKRPMLCVAIVLTVEGLKQLKSLGKASVVQALRHYLLQHYDRVLLPRRWRFMKQLPLSEGGKICRLSLLRNFEEQH